MKNKIINFGIFAHNEEKNIEQLIYSILSQKQIGFSICVFIYSDGSTDNTNKIVYNIAQKHKNVKLFNFKNRKGKIYRINQFYKYSNSDFIITCDSDIKIFDNKLVLKIFNELNDKMTSLINCNVQPLKSEFFMGKIIVAYERFWKYVTDQINHGNNIHNSVGCIMGLSRSLYKKISIPEDIVAEDHYIYIFCKKNNFKSKYLNKAIVYYKSPEKLKDYLNQFYRYTYSSKKLDKYFNYSIDKLYLIPRRIKINAYIKAIINNPFYTILSLFLQLIQRFHMLNKQDDINHLWSIIKSTK